MQKPAILLRRRLIPTTMALSRSFRRIALLCVITFGALVAQYSADAFQHSALMSGSTKFVRSALSMDRNGFFRPTKTVSETVLLAKKKPEEPEREKNDGLSLFLLYMTPWKNPNSIFVYMLLLLYVLGKSSEAHSAARMAGM
jgi:hypothetical protein